MAPSSRPRKASAGSVTSAAPLAAQTRGHDLGGEPRVGRVDIGAIHLAEQRGHHAVGRLPYDRPAHHLESQVVLLQPLVPVPRSNRVVGARGHAHRAVALQATHLVYLLSQRVGRQLGGPQRVHGLTHLRVRGRYGEEHPGQDAGGQER